MDCRHIVKAWVIEWTCVPFPDDDDDIDSNSLPDDELEQYFNNLVPPAMQRGKVEGQEIPATVSRLWNSSSYTWQAKIQQALAWLIHPRSH